MAEMTAVAAYFYELYRTEHGSCMNEMRMHKMMYFAQRESLMTGPNPLFCDTFEASKYGPVLPGIRNEYKSGGTFSGTYGSLNEEEKRLVKSVFGRYDKKSDWSLSTLVHAEYSWQQTRKGLSYRDPCHREIALSAIRVDATKERLRRAGVILNC